MKNKIEDLRDHLFATLEGLTDAEKPMALDRAEAIAKVAQTIVNAAKVEVDYLRVAAELPSGIVGTGFISPKEPKLLK